ncbi:PEP-CTERM sorting domain-containing protein [Trichormus variabilis]|uniref:PEP-CTERM protein-sorting domain-containing protein n=1 Tax=Trichormus variabilis SAG 1403-4b TaxID=447716 RepID=A0A3S1ADG7_ANAVA|nr:PEP-CTERM sorting domain-containing protein [Trichormus variabilis]MBD2625427.1 PEP-CTERM sorting domain-containing protein [Trichormus variabilis FACHB-164]RUS98712.1 hypothetical protein DSM107003_07310 [Trichormus variabilis SAG 1403-4b]
MGGKDGKWNDFLGAGTYPDGTRPYFPGIGEIDINPSKSRPYEFTSLIFQDNGDWRIPGWDHVALNLSNWIYESTQSPVAQNTTSTKADSELGFGAEVQLEYDNGVQNQRTLNVLQQYHQSKQVEEVPIDIDLGLKMAQAIMTKLDSKYQYITPDPGSWKNISSSRQKGGDNLFTCVGLIEWAAEQAGLNNGQGFLPDDREGFLTPSLLKDAVQNPNRYWGKSGNLWGMIYADPVDFILTDPLGRRLGYTQELGLLNEIPNTFYTGDGWSEQGYVPDLLQGQYTLDLFGLDDHAAVAFGNADNGVSFDGYLAKGEKRTLVYTVPEPSSVIGILSVSIVGAASLLKKRRKTQTI